MAGTLFVVATPIGNLQDISLRAIDTLKAADLIACEDTRHSGILLAAHGIRTPRTSYHSHSSAGKEQHLIEVLQEGRSVALISDAGMPGISDPGSALVREAIAAGIAVTVIPGPSAALDALVLSGFATDRFAFEGFLPVKPGPRRKRIERWKDEDRSIVFYESPHRLRRTLDQLVESLGPGRPLACARELTKKFEEVIRGTTLSVREHFAKHEPRGEFALVCGAEQAPGDVTAEIEGV